LYGALIDIGVTTFIPRFAHLPYVTGDGNKKLSKRDPKSNLFHHRDRGFIPEGLDNYLALLGWALTHDRDVFTLAEMGAAFDVEQVNPNPARFDVTKAEAINADHIRQLAPADFVSRLIPYLISAGIFEENPTSIERDILARVAPLIQSRITLLGEAPGMIRFLFMAVTTDESFEYDADAFATLPPNAPDVLAAATAALDSVSHTDWTHSTIEVALRHALVERLNQKPREAFGSLRVAVSGRRVSPPLFESLEILGKPETLARLNRLSATLLP
jgi:glutamyl-tRNA synthetase